MLPSFFHRTRSNSENVEAEDRKPWFQPGKWLAWAMALTGLFVLAVIVQDQIRLGFSDSYQKKKQAQRNEFCFPHVNPAQEVHKGIKVKDFSVAQREEYELALRAERERQESLPVGLLQKFEFFVLCARITGLDIAGLKVGTDKNALPGAVQVAASIAKVQTTQEDLLQLSALAAQLSETRTNLIDDRVRGQLQNISKVASTLTVAGQVDVSGATQNALNSAAGEELSTRVNSGEWLLVVGADQGNEAAIDQVKKTNMILEQAVNGGKITSAPQAELRLIRSWRRTVIPFPSKEEASDALKALQDDLPYGGYIRSQVLWCPDLAPVPAIGSIPTQRCAG